MVEWTVEGMMRACMNAVNEDKLRLGDEKELAKFRGNLNRFVQNVLCASGVKKAKAIATAKAGAFGLITAIPIVTPMITAMLQVITGEDLGIKMDKMLALQEKTISLQENLGMKMDKMLALQEKTISLQEKTISLQEKTLGILERRLPTF